MPSPAPSTFKPVWLIRAGLHGEDEHDSLASGLGIIGFHSVPSLEGVKGADEVLAKVERQSPGDKVARTRNRAAQLTAFVLKMEVGDTVVMPLKSSRSQIAFGRIAGPYAYKKVGDALRHVRPIEWVRPDVPRSTLAQDLLYSLGAFMTVCQVTRNGAERRLAAVLRGGVDPGLGEGPDAHRSEPVEEVGDDPALLNVAEAAEDQIVSRIQAKFREHDLARLVDAILRAEDYETAVSPPGPDGGVDILAGRGALGLEGQHLCVQVKSSMDPSDVKVFRELKGTMDSFKADVGLLVSWGGFTRALRQEARQSYFKVRLWGAGELLQAVYRNYDRLSEEIQAELPLKRVWALVGEELE
ncbi:MAG TPA: restriction endonuclease [Candidatus Eisenbacteria bacterium]|jgi:restriction system protein